MAGFIYCCNRLKNDSEGGVSMEKSQTVERQGDGHRLMMNGRKEAKLTGILKVISFEPELVLLMTDAGRLKITGKELHMTNLDIEKGILDLAGKVNCFCYTTDQDGGAFSIKRLLK